MFGTHLRFHSPNPVLYARVLETGLLATSPDLSHEQPEFMPIICANSTKQQGSGAVPSTLVQMFPVASDSEVPSKRHESASRDLDPYSEQEINQVAEHLLRDRKDTWSQNPRLYIILRDIGQIEETSQPQLLDNLINDGFNDFWIPVASVDILQQILPHSLHSQFVQAQGRVCVEPVDFRLGLGNFHAHFREKNGPPFSCIRRIGRGYKGIVDEVLSLTDGQVYARKSIRKLSDFPQAQNDIRRFRSELQALSRIKYKHCVEIVRNSASSPVIL
jgi:hypothetical protein